LSTIAGLAFTTGDGSSDANMTFSGNLANINTALEGMVFTSTPGFFGATTLTVDTDDLGSTGSGGNQTDSEQIDITVLQVDFGDLNDTYGSLRVSDGAAHTIDPALYLGASVDSDLDGQAPLDGTGDDLDGNDDEDGVTFHLTLESHPTKTYPTAAFVEASTAGKLDAWIDYDASGTFDAGEHIGGGTSVDLVAGSNLVPIDIPAGATVGTSYARFRISSAGGLSPTSRADDGEVEDYEIDIITVQAPVVPDVQRPIGPQTSNFQPTITWTTDPINVLYDLRIETFMGAPVLAADGLTGSSFVPPTDLPPELYVTKVRSYNRAGDVSAWSPNHAFQILAIELTDPAGVVGIVIDPTPTFNWTGVNVSDHYELLVQTDTGSTVIQETALPGGSTSFTPASNLAVGNYEATIQAVDPAAEAGDVSPLFTFSIVSPNVTAPPANNTGLQPVVTWDAVPGAASYDIRIDNVTTGQSSFIVDTGLTSTSYTPPVMPQGDFTAFVRAIDNAGAVGHYSTGRDYNIDVPTPATPVINGPPTPSMNRLPEFHWNSVAFGSTYELRIDNVTTGVNDVVHVSGLTTTSYLVTSLLPDADYQAFVRATNIVDESSSYSGAAPFTVDTTLAPELTGPIPLTSDDTPEMTWTAVTGAASYELRLDNLSTGVNDILSLTGLTTTSFTPVLPLAEGDYQFRVRADNGQGDQGDWSADRAFEIRQVPIMTGPSSPSGDIFLHRPTITWAAAPDSTRYDLWVNQIGVTHPVIRETNLTSPDFTPSTDMPDNTYRAWVRAYDANGTVHRWSDPIDFRIVSVEVTHPASEVIDTTPSIAWTVLLAATSYEVKVDDLTNGITDLIRQAGLDVAAFVPTNPLDTGTYRASVRPYDFAGTPGDWSEPRDFSIVTSSFITPSSRTMDHTPTFTWTTLDEADHYHLWVEDALVAGPALIYETNLTTPSFTSSFLPSGNYRAYLRAVDTHGATGAWSSAYNFSIQTVTPTLTGPIGGTLDRTPEITWNPVDGAETYDLWLSDITNNPFNTTPLIRETMLTGTSFVPTSDLADGTYRIWLRATNAEGENSSWSAQIDFSISLTPVPSPIAPSGLSETATPEFQWHEIAGISRFGLSVVDSVTDAEVLANDNIFSNTFTPSTPLVEGIYRWSVRSYNSAGEVSEFSDPVVFYVDVPAPNRPTVTAPTGTVLDENATFEWTSVTHATTYDLWVRNIVTNRDQVIREQGLTTTTFTPTEALQQSTYRTWVRAANGLGEYGPWSVSLDFTIEIPTPEPPVVTGPSGTISTSPPTFTWQAVEYARTYDIYVNSLTTGQSQVLRVTDATGTSHTPETLLPNGSYRVWIRALNSAMETSNWSTPSDFTIQVHAPTAPFLLNPTGTVGTALPTFEWTSSAFASRYDLYVSNTTTGQSQVYRNTNITSTSFTLPTPLTNGHSYQAWVRSINVFGETSHWSNPVSFEIQVTQSLQKHSPVEDTPIDASDSTSTPSVNQPAPEMVLLAVGDQRPLEIDQTLDLHELTGPWDVFAGSPHAGVHEQQGRTDTAETHQPAADPTTKKTANTAQEDDQHDAVHDVMRLWPSTEWWDETPADQAVSDEKTHELTAVLQSRKSQS